MVKVHVPWEARGWNAYGVLALEDTGRRPGRRRAASARRRRRRPRRGRCSARSSSGPTRSCGTAASPASALDVSLGVWELDLYAEAALRQRRRRCERWRARPPGRSSALERVRHDGAHAAARRGRAPGRRSTPTRTCSPSAPSTSTTTRATPTRSLYSVPPRGAAPPLPGEPSPVLALLPRPAPGRRSSRRCPRRVAGTTPPSRSRSSGTSRTARFVARLDHSVLALTYLRVETFVAGHFGRRGGGLPLRGRPRAARRAAARDAGEPRADRSPSGPRGAGSRCASPCSPLTRGASPPRGPRWAGAHPRAGA